MKTLHENEAVSSWSDSWRKTLRMVLISACVGGIEFSYAAEMALVSPLLLQLGVPVYLMTMTWCVSPLLGMVLVPILGSASDTCTSSLGRRRPFIIIYSVGVVFGLLLVPYGRNIGELLGDGTYSKLTVLASDNHTTLSLMDNQTSFVNQTLSAAQDEHVPNHRIGIIFTIIGLMILDFCCDGCQIPSRTLMVDLTTDKDRTRGLSMFSAVAGAGGMVGFTLAGIGYHSQTSSGILDPLFFKHVHVVFGVVLGLYLLGSMLTVFGVSETPLNKKDSIHKYKRMYSEDDSKDQISEHKLSESESSSSQNSYNRLNMTEMKEELGSTATLHSEETTELVSPTPAGSDEEKQLDEEETAEDMRVFLKTIINMPRYMWILCLTNLLSWMALVTFSLYYTDFVGQSVYGGSPLSPVGSEKRNIYDKGVRMGSLGMVAYSFSSCLFSFFLDKLITVFKTKIVYVGGLMTNCIGMGVMAATNNYVVAFIAPLTTGVLYTTTFTVPYILVSRYHSDKTLTPLKLEKGETQKRGLGTDIAIVSSVVFVGQFTISAVIGIIIHAAGSTIMVPIVGSILALCAAISASFVEYLDY